MAFIRVASLKVLPAGSAIQVEASGKAYAVCNVDGQIYCTDGICPHVGGPLGEGALNGSILVCPWHAWGFDCRTGKLEGGGDEDGLATYAAEVQGDEIYIDIG